MIMKRHIIAMAAILLAIVATSCHKENISIIDKVSYRSDSETKLLQIIANCGWTASVDDPTVDWISISPVSGTKSDTAIAVTVSEYLENNIRSASFTVTSSKGNASRQVTIEQNGEYIKVTENILSFFSDAESKTITVTSNCDWTLGKESNSDFTTDFYTASPTSGNVGSTDLNITVSNNFATTNYLGLFRLKSSSGNTETPVRVKQNGRNDSNITSSVWGVYQYERWNTDYYNNILEETYTTSNYVPTNFNSPGWTMYFLKNNHGEQSDRKYNNDNVLIQVFYPFDYQYDTLTQKLHIVFESEDPEVNEYYDTDVLTLNDSIFIIQDEYRDHFFEKASMRKVGYVDEKSVGSSPRKTGRKKPGHPLFEL